MKLCIATPNYGLLKLNSWKIVLGFLALIYLGLFAIFSVPAAAQSSGNFCIKQEVGGNPPCAANDVRVTSLVLLMGPMICDPTNLTPFSVTLEATIESSPDRFDIGLWVNESGRSALDDPTGTCYRDFFPPPLSATLCEQDGGPYFDNDGDNCGDVYASGTDPCLTAVTVPCSEGGGTCLISTREFTLDIICVDSNGDGSVDVGTCTSWDNNDDTLCVDELDTNPGNGAKCDCGDGPKELGIQTSCVSDDECGEGTSNNGLFCDGEEICDPDDPNVDELGCVVVDALDCDDGVSCTDDSCNLMTDQCDNVANNANCANGDFCDGDETCDEINDCQPGTSPNCDDGVSCTDDSCNETTDQCDNVGNACDQEVGDDDDDDQAGTGEPPPPVPVNEEEITGNSDVNVTSQVGAEFGPFPDGTTQELVVNVNNISNQVEVKLPAELQDAKNLNELTIEIIEDEGLNVVNAFLEPDVGDCEEVVQQQEPFPLGGEEIIRFVCTIPFFANASFFNLIMDVFISGVETKEPQGERTITLEISSPDFLPDEDPLIGFINIRVTDEDTGCSIAPIGARNMSFFEVIALIPGVIFLRRIRRRNIK